MSSNAAEEDALACCPPAFLSPPAVSVLPCHKSKIRELIQLKMNLIQLKQNQSLAGAVPWSGSLSPSPAHRLWHPPASVCTSQEKVSSSLGSRSHDLANIIAAKKSWYTQIAI